jgi:hypothetical protein
MVLFVFIPLSVPIPARLKLMCRRNRRSYVELQQPTHMLKIVQPWKSCSTVTAGRLFSRSRNLQVSPLHLLLHWILMIQEVDIMEMEQGITLHLRHSMISGLTHLLVVLVVGVGAMADREYVLIVLLSMRVLGRIVISVDYLLVGRQEQLKETEASMKSVTHGKIYMYINMHTS